MNLVGRVGSVDKADHDIDQAKMEIQWQSFTTVFVTIVLASRFLVVRFRRKLLLIPPSAWRLKPGAWLLAHHT